MPAADVLAWARSSQRAAQAAAYELLAEEPHRITPPLMEDTTGFRLRYLEACLQEDHPQPSRVFGRWDAAREALRWLLATWQEHGGQQRGQTADAVLTGIRSMLSRSLLSGGPATREAILLGCLEHAFQVPEVAAFFAERRAHPELRGVYEEGLAPATGWRTGGAVPGGRLVASKRRR